MTDRAVSPVIGVILMVAIVIILAAVIAAFVFGAIPNEERYVTFTVANKYACPAHGQGFYDHYNSPDMFMIETTTGECYEVNAYDSNYQTDKLLWDSFEVNATYAVYLNPSGDIDKIIDYKVCGPCCSGEC